ncbi:hypothetical protein Dtox_0110 [Desulfofarcimen acetoxidans DSM 771]|uniref:Uncharacterized protein n=1 Tax=Desulfofarcimen acetoxidans (strain ATCC 49208 / DSM 771 / KCTC 5769 / VKM B-1644 / 5575) TaxID=485916 RepID=C8W2R7_DESAS|nr:hypothetical protein Dtox_0110 [Desulfofarcimen acetoxidans DSM 771]
MYWDKGGKPPIFFTLENCGCAKVALCDLNQKINVNLTRNFNINRIKWYNML